MMACDRYLFVGGYVTEDVKKALIAEARRRRMSRSRLIHEILKKELNVQEEA